MTVLPRVRRGSLGLVAEWAGRSWLLPLTPSAEARAELARLSALVASAPGDGVAAIDYRAVAGPAGADWAALPGPVAVLLVRYTAECWGMALCP